MRTTSTLLKSLAVLSALLPFCSSGLASIVYDNSTTDLNLLAPASNGVAIGDEINLAGTDRLVNDFKFEYYLSGNAAGGETLQLTLYANDGLPAERTVNGVTRLAPSPGTVLYTSPVLNMQAGFQTAEASAFQVLVPDTFTWAVTFQGLGAAEVAGLRVYDGPTVGTSFADFWQQSGGTWNTYLLPNDSLGNPVAANFAARVSAVPEPTTLALALLAGLSWVGFLGYKRRSS